MKNPFFVKYNSRDNYYYIGENSSINKLVLAKLPVDGVEDSLVGEKAGYVINAKDIIKDIKDNHKILKMDIDKLSDFELMKEVASRFMDEDDEVREAALGIARKYGYRLGLVLLTLKTGLKENREARSDWKEEHWLYYKNVKRFVLAGGLTHTIFGEKLRTYALEVFKMANVEPYDILLFNNASHLGVKGCSMIIKDKRNSNLVFDFGQTRIKRSLITMDNQNIKEQIFLESYDSKYMHFRIDDEQEKRKVANKLHNYIKDIIVCTYKELDKNKVIGDEIIVSIASYVVDGKLNNHRGGYAKLASISDNYESYLTKEVSDELGRNVTIKFIHDGTAIALYFKEYKDTVCLSLGTAIGVGHPYSEIIT